MKVHVLAILFAVNFLASCGGGSNLLDDPSMTNEEPMDPGLVGEETLPTSDFGSPWQISPYDHGQAEIALTPPRVVTRGIDNTGSNVPITYNNVFDRERELFGYDPRFVPGRPYFDKYNLPWIYVNNYGQLGGNDPAYPINVSVFTGLPTDKELTATTNDDGLYGDLYSDESPCQKCDGYILRLQPDGKWVSISVKGIANEFGFRKHSLGVNGHFYSRIQQIYFQDNGDVFFRADHGVIRYIQSSNEWTGYPKDWIGSYYMVGNGTQPPLFIKNNWPERDRFLIQRLVGGGNLSWQELEINHQKALEIARYSHPVVWVDDTLHIAAYDASEPEGRENHNSAVSYVRYHLSSGATDEFFMGWTGSPSQEEPDNHNMPAIIVDSKKYLHFISGAHNHQIWHRKSKLPVTDMLWSHDNLQWPEGTSANEKFSAGPETPVSSTSDTTDPQPDVVYVGSTSGNYTYVHTKIDKQDNIHIAVRNHREKYTDRSKHLALTYIKGVPKGNGDYDWIEKGDLVYPNWNGYSVYRQKLTTDRLDRIYVSYNYAVGFYSKNLWYHKVNHQRTYDQNECESITVPEDCINLYSEHNRRWNNEPFRFSSGDSFQQFQHDFALIGSDDGGNTWTLTTTEEFLRRQQSPNLSNIVVQ